MDYAGRAPVTRDPLPFSAGKFTGRVKRRGSGRVGSGKGDPNRPDPTRPVRV